VGKAEVIAVHAKGCKSEQDKGDDERQEDIRSGNTACRRLFGANSHLMYSHSRDRGLLAAVKAASLEGLVNLNDQYGLSRAVLVLDIAYLLYRFIMFSSRDSFITSQTCPLSRGGRFSHPQVASGW